MLIKIKYAFSIILIKCAAQGFFDRTEQIIVT